ncbi:13311_t:CDS:2, partial [Entrophospora sp. SA101]
KLKSIDKNQQLESGEMSHHEVLAALAKDKKDDDNQDQEANILLSQSDKDSLEIIYNFLKN